MKRMLKRLPRPTIRSLWLALVVLVFGGYGLTVSDYVAYQVAAFALATLILSYIISYLNFRKLQIELRIPAQAFAEERFGVRVIVTNLKTTFASYAIEVDSEVLGNGCYFRSVEPVFTSHHADSIVFDELGDTKAGGKLVMTSARKRGVYETFGYRIRTIFPFGLFYCERHGTVSTHLAVFPKPLLIQDMNQLDHVEIHDGDMSSLRPRDSIGEFRGLREFSEGDSLRMVHWVRSAKFQELVVREFDPPCPDKVVIAFHSYRPAGSLASPRTEHALQLLAGLFLQLTRAGASFDFVASFNKWQHIRVEEDCAALDHALHTLAEARVARTRKLTPLLRFLADPDFEGHRVIVISDVCVEHWRKLFRFVPHAICASERADLFGAVEEVPI